MRFILTAGQAVSSNTEGATIVHADAWDPAQGELSLPRIMNERLLDIRTAHAAWAYELGKVRLANSSVSERLQGSSALSMWWCSLLYERHPKVTPGLYELYSLRALEALMEERGANALTTVGCSSLTNAMLKEMCTGRGWSFSVESEGIPPRSKGRLRRIYDATPAPIRAVLRLAHWLVKVRRILRGPVELPASSQATGTVVTYFPNIDMKLAGKGIFRSRYWESLHDALRRNPQDGPSPVRWLFIRFPSPQGSLQELHAMCEAFRKAGRDGISFNYLEEFLSPKDILSCLGRWLRIAFQSLLMEKDLRPRFHLEGSRLNFWPLLRTEYAESFRGWRCLERCLQQRGIENYVRVAGRQDWYTFPLENCPWERMLTWAVHEQGAGPVYGAQHSTIRPTDLRYFDDARTWLDAETNAWQPDRVAGNGAGACAQWKDAGVPEERLTRIEALRYLYLSSTRGTGGEGRPTQLLVVTSFFEDETAAHLALLAESIREGLLDGYEVTVKPHPYLPVEERLRAMLGTLADRLRFSTSPISEELIRNPLVWASNSTTVALEAAVKGLPVMVMRPVGDFDLCPLQDVAGLARTSDLASVREALAHATPLELDSEYLCLTPSLPRWRALLGLDAGEEEQ